MTAAFRPVASALCLAALAAVTAACSGAPVEELREVDLVVADRLTSDREAPQAAQRHCADETRWSLALQDGEELSALVELGSAARLDLGGCVSRPVAGSEPQEEEELEIAVISLEGGGALTAKVPLPKFTRRWHHRLELGQVAAGTARVRLKVDLAAGRELYLWDAVLRHRVAAAPKGEDRREPPTQILLISVDTLREDAVGALGGRWPTPELDRLFAGSEVYRPHYAAASWTKPSHGSLLTGQSPLVHGAGEEEEALLPEVPTLAERFRAAGFATGGLVFDCLWLDPRFGFARGFDAYRSVLWTLPQMARHAAAWMADHRDDPFFFFFHTFEPHSDFHRLPYEGAGVTLATVRQRFGVEDYGCRDDLCASGLLAAVNQGRAAPRAEDREILPFLYGAGVTHLDEGLGALFAALREAGMFDRMLIVLTSDHGESLLEHPGALLHGNYWEEVLRVPLAIKWPAGARAGERREHPTSALDLAPTLLAAAGLEAGDLPGRDLRRSRPDRPVFSWGVWRVAVAGTQKAVLLPHKGEKLLFDLGTDPGESRDLTSERPDALARLEELIEARWALDHEMAAAQDGGELRAFTAEERRRLEALGYLGNP